MPESRSSEPAPRGGRSTVLWVGTTVLAAAATGVLVLSDDSRLLKLALVGALWAALLAAFATARLRNRIADEDERASEMQRIYELELEREVAARQEFEAEAEIEARRRVAEESEKELQALKAELRNLRETLEQVLGGDVLFERVALRAESTRVRSLAENSGQAHNGRVIQQREDWGRELPAGQSNNMYARASGTVDGDLGTHVMSSVPDQQQAPPEQRRPAPSPRPQQPARPQQRPQARSAQGQVESRELTRPSTVRRAPEQRRAPQYEQPAERSRESMAAPEPIAAPYSNAPQYSNAASQPGPDSPSHQAGWAETSRPQRQDTGSAPEPQRPQQPSKTPPPVAAGAHTEGTSVNELLAAYGNTGESQRRRRRRE